jgi:hypothetical protein
MPGANVMIAPSTAQRAMTTIDVVLCETNPNTSTEIPRIGIDANSRTNMTRAASHLPGRCATVRGIRSAIALGSGFTATSTMRCRTVFASMPLMTGGNAFTAFTGWTGFDRRSTGRTRTVSASTPAKGRIRTV